MTDEQLINVNSIRQAVKVWEKEFGEVDYYSNESDINQVETQLDDFKEELHSLENEISQREVSQMSPFKLNKAIALHFMIEAGEVYLFDTKDVVYNKYRPEHEDDMVPEIDHSIEYDPDFDELSDPWRENGLFPPNDVD